MEVKKLIPILMTLIALLMVVIGFFFPWWSIKTTREAEAALNATARADYGFFGTVSANRKAGNETQSVFLPIGNLTVSEGDTNAWNFIFNVFLGLVAGGMSLTIISEALLIFSIFRKPSHKFALFTIIALAVAAVLLLCAPFYVAATSEPLLAKLSSVMPVEVPSRWVPIVPTDIGSFWGSKPIPKTSPFPSWIQGGNFWIWGADLGWHLMFTSGLLLLASVILVRQTTQE